MVSVVVIEFSGMRCQPLRRALGANQFLEPSIIVHGEKMQFAKAFQYKK
ncbi:damage-inducible protein DinB, partial [Vibrio cholerae]|nr:damage-inducible protein DinB [Vibrio cholerae]